MVDVRDMNIMVNIIQAIYTPGPDTITMVSGEVTTYIVSGSASTW